MIDAYDTLNISLEATEEEIKKAYKRLSLQYHPDKVLAQTQSEQQDASEKFHEIKLASDILQDPERRKIYDTFGIDLGEERPEMEVWTIGLGTLLSPMGSFALKTAICRLILWFIDFRWVGRFFVLCGLVLGGLYYIDFKYKDIKLRETEGIPMLVGLVEGLLFVNWIWPLLADGVGVFYLATEVVGVPILLDNWKVAGCACFGSLVMAWLARGWWWWILGIEVVLAIIMLAALTVAAGIMKLWIDNVQAQHSDKLKTQRRNLRKRREAYEKEVADLKKRLEDLGVSGDALKRPAR